MFSPQRVAVFLTLVLCAAALVWLTAPVLAPFVVAAVCAYVLHPLVARLHRFWGAWVPKWGTVLCVQVVSLLVLCGVWMLMVPMLLREWPVLRDQLPSLLDRVEPALRSVAAALGVGWGEGANDVAHLKRQLREWLQANGSDWVAPLWASVQVGSSVVLAVLGHVVLVPLVLFFMLHDGAAWLGRAHRGVPRRWRASVSRFVRDCDQVLGEYLRGQLRVMLALAVFYSAGLAVFGLKLALPIGVFTGLAVCVPYFGFGLGVALALLAGVLEMAPWQAVAMVSVVYGLGQLIESVVLTPRWVGERIGLHPLAVIFSLLVFGHWWGFVGVLVALPLSAVLWVALRRAKAVYLASAFYAQPDGSHPA